MKDHVGIVGIGIYLPKERMTAKQISEATDGYWTEEAVVEKLGIIQKVMPGDDPRIDGTQEMGAKASLNLLERTGYDPLKIDVILCVGEEWKEYLLTTSALYIQDRIGAINAWGIDLANRCCTTISAMKIAKDMLLSDPQINSVLIAGGYRNCDYVDYADKAMSMMYNLGAGGGAILLEKNYGQNEFLGTHVMSDGSLARTAGVEIGGQINPITPNNVGEAKQSLRVMDPVKMKDRLNEVSMSNWYHCIDESLKKSGGLTRKDINFLSCLHMKRSGHLEMLEEIGVTRSQSIYLENYGHIGQVDQLLILDLALREGTIKAGSIISSIAAGIGYVWAANVIRWGKISG